MLEFNNQKVFKARAMFCSFDLGIIQTQREEAVSGKGLRKQELVIKTTDTQYQHCHHVCQMRMDASEGIFLYTEDAANSAFDECLQLVRSPHVNWISRTISFGYVVALVLIFSFCYLFIPALDNHASCQCGEIHQPGDVVPSWVYTICREVDM